MFGRKMRKIVVIALIFLLMFSQMPQSTIRTFAETENDAEEDTTNVSSADDIVIEETASILNNKYSLYLEDVGADVYAGDDIVFDDVSSLTDAAHIMSYEGMDVIHIERNQEVTISIDAPESALYYIGLSYSTNEQNILPVQLEMKVNGEFPFYELRNLVFESRWENPEEIAKDKYGNEIIPQPIKVIEWLDKYIGDSSYRGSDPFLIELQKGTNELTFDMIEGDIIIKSIALSSPKTLSDYERGEVTGDELIIIEAEDMAYRNDSSIRAGALFDVDLTPYNSSKRVLNYLDSDSFKKPGHKVEYEFEVKESGYYYLGMHYRQDSKIDFPVFINIEIDGEIPFKQFKNYPVLYTTNFTNSTFVDEENDQKIPVYLEEGIHTIGFTIALDPIKPIIEETEFVINEIQALSLEITNLVGTNTDRYRDIDVESFIPGITDQFIGWADQLNDLYEEVKKFNPEANDIGAFSAFNIAEKQLRSLAKEVDKLIVRKNELSTGPNSITAHLSNLLQDINNNGIAIDKIYFYQNEKDLPKGESFIKKQWAKLQRLVKSFGDQDYSIDNVNPDHLQVWVNRPRQYIEIIQRLIDEDFTPKTGIEVDLSLMPDQNKLILSNAAGEAPDVAIATNYALPFEIAIRGALQDLTEFDDFEEVAERFPRGLLVPATVHDGVYAIPDTMNFWVLFYREDILESLGLPVPDTLEQVKSYLPELQRKGMNFFFPTAGMPGLKIFAGTMPVIYQNGGRFYGETISRTTLNEEEAIEGMRELTELFTIYNVPYDVPSFYQQFRDGSIPIGISDYFMYNLILNAAPEIANSWDIALMPGVENEDGEIERWSAGGAESNFIFKDSDKKEEAWEFLKWWSSTEVQVAFGNILQTTYGREYIWNPANIEAYEGLPWITDHKEVILAQTEWLTEVPRVPGSYMVEREISNAYNSIVLDGENLRTAIDLASKRINRETDRKLEEFGYMRNGKIIVEYPNPEFNND